MNSSQRRATVIKRSIAVGLLWASLGAVAAATAAADGGDETGGAVASNSNGVGRGGSAVAGTASGDVGPRTRRGVRSEPTLDYEWHPHPYWCEFIWPQWSLEPPLPYNGNRNAILSQFLPTQTPVAVISGVGDVGEHMSTALTEAPPEAPPPAAAESPAAPVGLGAVPPAFPATRPAPPAAAPPPDAQPESVASEPERGVPRLPELPSADLAQIAAVALPGLAGIAALTALGGFLGYRQAKAGYGLRAAGTARFLQ